MMKPKCHSFFVILWEMSSIINVLSVTCSFSILGKWFGENHEDTMHYPMHDLHGNYQGMEMKAGLRISDLPSGVFGVASYFNPEFPFVPSLVLVQLRQKPDPKSTLASVKRHLVVGPGGLPEDIAIQLIKLDTSYALIWGYTHGNYPFVVDWTKSQATAEVYKDGTRQTFIRSKTPIVLWKPVQTVPMTDVEEILGSTGNNDKDQIEAAFHKYLQTLFNLHPKPSQG